MCISKKTKGNLLKNRKKRGYPTITRFRTWEEYLKRIFYIVIYKIKKKNPRIKINL